MPIRTAISKARTSVEGLQDRLEAYMTRKGLRSTSQRKVVTDVFFQSDGHLSIEDLWALVRKKDHRVGYATVYRTLKMLAESGLASERHFSDGVSRFEVAHHGHHHDHLICTACGKIEEFEDDRIEHLQENVAKRHGYELSSHKHELYGTCPACQALKSTQ